MVNTVLVVEDSNTIRFAHQRLLEKHGYHVLTAKDGEEALTSLETFIPDLILMDVVMPNLNGYQVTRKIKSNPELKHIPIVLISSKSEWSDKIWGLRQGADAYLVKPVNEHQLLHTIASESLGSAVSG